MSKNFSFMMTVVWISSALLLGCGASLSTEDIPGDAEGPIGGEVTGGGDNGGNDSTGEPPLISDDVGCDQMDLLFVIDNSGSMGEEQVNLTNNFPLFTDVINGFKNSTGQPIDYRLGVTTTGVTKRIREELTPIGGSIDRNQYGADGALVNGECTEETRPWLERGDSSISSKFSCMANVGTRGPAKEMPLEAVRLAIGPRVDDGVNSEFFRDDALLAVVFLTDEDDCSRQDEGRIRVDFGDNVCDVLHPVDDYVTAIDDFKGERAKWATAVIAGLENCSSDLGTANQATRLLDFASQTGENAVTSSICQGDLSSALQDALETFDAACQNFPPIE